MFDKLKQIGRALSPDAIRQGLAASREAMASGGRLSEEQLAAMTPEQRATYDDAMARMQTSVDEAIGAERARRVLLGPAGEHLYGPMPDREAMTTVDLGAQLAQARAGFGQALRETVRGRTAPVPPVAAVSADPAVQAAHERAGRDEARTPYLAPDRSPVVLTRVATGRQQPLEELAAWLGSSGLAGRPDLVYGVARVPDHVPGGLGIRKAAIVEWEVVHAATAGLPPTAPAAQVAFDARERWAARSPGEPSVLDEDLGLEYLHQAGLGPDRCLGIARRVGVAATGGGDEGESPRVLIGVTGVVVLHPADAADGAGAVLERMAAARPLQVVPAPDVRVTVLNWLAIRRVVMPRTDRRPVVPSPFPYLPSTPQELLQAHLEIVGVQPRDCYSAQVTQDQVGNIIGGTAHVTTTGAESEPAADGQVRSRFRGGSRVVVAYRDKPEYAAGRARWAAYEREVLQAQLAVDTAVRAPVDRQSALDRGVLGALVRGAEAVGDVVTGYGWDSTDFDQIPHFRYCWPPIQ
ncbi:hypothetical protein RB608_21520 [Nocardioides sp. LHD-245]|uniref:hypothetical protein n=1 Tax=Nocardioides sp. LHD-245 TaxID=3051387 RepID=UPI0027DF1F36|nr:hypothetical protein [Nocardioides sp. LHD-245]